MGAFASWIRELFQQLIGAFVQREVSRGVAVTAAFAGFLALIASLASALFLAMQTALQAIVWNIQTPELQTFIGVFWPPHYSACLSVILSARAARWVYDRSVFATQAYWQALSR